MREIVTVLGKLDDVVDTNIPEDLVRFLSGSRPLANAFFCSI